MRFQSQEAPKEAMLDKLSNYIIVDIGANLTNKKFSRDLDQVIQRAREAGVPGTLGFLTLYKTVSPFCTQKNRGSGKQVRLQP